MWMGLIPFLEGLKVKVPHFHYSLWPHMLLSRFSPTLCNPIDGSPPGSPVPGILQARTLEWVAISFSNAWKWKVKVKSLSRIRLLVIPWITAYQASLSMGFSRQEYWSGSPLPSPWSHIVPGNSPGQNTGVGSLFLLQGIFLTHGLNSCLPHCRQILYCLSHQGSTNVMLSAI